MLECLKIQPAQIDTLIGIESDESWKPAFKRVCAAGPTESEPERYGIRCEFYTELEEAAERIPQADILIASHLLHEEAMVEAFRALIEKAPDAVVLVAGCAPIHFLGGPISEASIQGFFPRTYYRWETSHLRRLAEATNLSAITHQAVRDPAVQQPKDQPAKRPNRLRQVALRAILLSLAPAIGVGVVTQLAGGGAFWAFIAGSVSWLLLWIAVCHYLLSNDCESASSDEAPYPPFAIVSRRLHIDEEVVSSLVQWIEIKYGYRLALLHLWRLRRYLKLMKTHPEPSYLSFHDIVYAFERRQAPK